MSGDGAGIIIGALFLIGALPMILTAGAAVAAAVGVGKLGKAALSAAGEHHDKVTLEVNECSSELSRFYVRLEETVAKQERLGEEYYKRLDAELSATEASIKQTVSAAGDQDVSRMNQSLNAARSEVSRALGVRRQAEMERIHREAEEESARIITELENAQRLRVEAAAWNQSTASARAQQTTLAKSVMRDAEASIRLIRTIADSDGDPSFRAKVSVLESSLRMAQDSLGVGLIQMSATSAQQIITRSASLALEHEQTRSERDFVRAAVRGRLEGLKAELESLEWMDFVDERFGHVTEHMDDFTQGAFSQLMSDIEGELNDITGHEGGWLSSDALELKLLHIENDLVPRADSIVRTGHTRLSKFYERMHALSILERHMKDQGYQCDWKQMAGGDATQKAVVHFTEPMTGNSIAVSLDDDDPEAAELNRMAMEVMFYFANGQVVTEPEKQHIRAGMLDALATAGLSGQVACTGSLDGESNDQSMREQSSVADLPVRTLNI